jgi:hypothetical protein
LCRTGAIQHQEKTKAGNELIHAQAIEYAIKPTLYRRMPYVYPITYSCIFRSIMPSFCSVCF